MGFYKFFFAGFFVIFIFSEVIIAQNIKQEYCTVKGSVNIDTGKVYFWSFNFNNKKSEIIDSTDILHKKFTKHLSTGDLNFCTIKIKGFPYIWDFCIDGKKININIDTTKKKFVVKGGAENKLMDVQIKSFLDFYIKISDLYKENTIIKDFTQRVLLEDSIRSIDSLLYQKLTRYIDTNKNHISTLMAVSQFNNDIHSKDGYRLLHSMPEDIQKTEDWKNLDTLFKKGLEPKITKGTNAPDFILSDTSDNAFSTKQFKGKTILLDFWASWCLPCIKELPYVKDLNEKYSSRGLVIISISIDKYQDKWKRAINENNLTWYNVIDNGNKEVQKKYGINAIPRKILIDRNGKIVAINIEPAHLEEEIKKLLTN